MTFNDLRFQIRRLNYTSKALLIPFVIKLFISQIIDYSKSEELAKRSCDNIIKRTLAEI